MENVDNVLIIKVKQRYHCYASSYKTDAWFVLPFYYQLLIETGWDSKLSALKIKS